MTSDSLRQLAADALADIKGQDIVTLDVNRQTDIADYMIVASGSTARQVKSLVNNVLAKAKVENVQVLGVEGQDTCEWVLIDLGDVIVHVMLPKIRAFYDLERLWSLGPKKEGHA